MDSEARHPDVLVVYATHKLVGCCWNGADTGDETLDVLMLSIFR